MQGRIYIRRKPKLSVDNNIVKLKRYSLPVNLYYIKVAA
jgi:hypothetical protein